MFVALAPTISCQKSSHPVTPASINVVNALSGSDQIIPIFGTNESIRNFANAQTISIGSSMLYTLLSGPIDLYVIQSTDTALFDKSKLFTGKFNLINGGIYSLFLAGDTTNPDTLFIQDNIPTYTDSLAGLRFVNLSSPSHHFTINIQGHDQVNQLEITDLSYKSITPFKQYLTNSSIPGNYVFEIHDQATGDLLTNFTWNYTLFKNSTLIIVGPSTQVYQIDNF